MPYDNRLFGENKDALTHSLYYDDYGVATHTPIDAYHLVSEVSGDNLTTEVSMEPLVSEISA